MNRKKIELRSFKHRRLDRTIIIAKRKKHWQEKCAETAPAIDINSQIVLILMKMLTISFAFFTKFRLFSSDAMGFHRVLWNLLTLRKKNYFFHSRMEGGYSFIRSALARSSVHSESIYSNIWTNFFMWFDYGERFNLIEKYFVRFGWSCTRIESTERKMFQTMTKVLLWFQSECETGNWALEKLGRTQPFVSEFAHFQRI